MDMFRPLTNKMKSLLLFAMLAATPFFLMGESADEQAPGPYQPNWKSLAQHEAAPEWFQDAKLGIYFHWGVYTVPAFSSEWYPRYMFFPEHEAFKHHLETYGHPSEFAYHDFVPMFKAEHFDATEWVELFKEAGARFVGPVVEHHDGFSMWDSEVTPWNAADKGPKKDILGEIAEAAKANDLKLITTFHHARNLQRYQDNPEEEYEKMLVNRWNGFSDSHYIIREGYPTISDDPDLAMLYGNIPEEQWLENVWLAKVKEVVDRYEPDIIWFDSWLDSIPESYRARMAAYYLNRSHELGKEVMIVRKQDDLPLSFSVDDLEKSRKNELESHSWMTDETLSTGSWSYTEGLTLKPAKDVLHILIDIVSKNGVLLLNVSPKSNGVIPENQRQSLRTLGAWLKIHGEAIYGTRPWYTFGEGPTVQPEGSFENAAEFAKLKYSYKDIRYTTKGSDIYATLLGQPEEKSVTLTAFAKAALPGPLQVESVTLVGSNLQLEWELGENGLHLTADWANTNPLAISLKIRTSSSN